MFQCIANCWRGWAQCCNAIVTDLAFNVYRVALAARLLRGASIDARHAQARALQRRRDALDGSCCIGHTGRCSKCASAAAPRRPM